MCDDSNLIDGNCINLNFLYSNSHLICRNTSEKDTFCRNVEMFLKMNVACFIALGLATAGLIVGLANFCFVYSYLRSLYDQKFKKDVFGTIPLATRFAISAVMMQSSEPSGRGKQGPSVDYRRHSRLPKREPFLIPWSLPPVNTQGVAQPKPVLLKPLGSRTGVSGPCRPKLVVINPTWEAILLGRTLCCIIITWAAY